MGRVRERLASRPPQGHNRRVMKTAADGVVREALDVIVQCFVIDVFDGAGDARVQRPLAVGPRLLVDHLANAIVYEVETFTEMAKDPSPHQFFHGLGGIGVVETGGPPEQRELKRAADHGGRRLRRLEPRRCRIITPRPRRGTVTREMSSGRDAADSARTVSTTTNGLPSL